MTDLERRKIHTYQLDGLTPKQISERTGISQNTVKVHCYRNPVSQADIADHKGLCRHCGRPLIQTPHKKVKRYCSDKYACTHPLRPLYRSMECRNPEADHYLAAQWPHG